MYHATLHCTATSSNSSSNVLCQIFGLLIDEPDATLLNPSAKEKSWHHARCPRATGLFYASLVNHTWHAVAQDMIDQELDLTLSSINESRNISVLSRLQHGRGSETRVQHLVIRDMHTAHFVPLGVADIDPDIDSDDESGTPAEQDYFSKDYVLVDPPETSLRTQLEAVCSFLSNQPLRSFTWNAIPPIPQCIVQTLSATNIDAHIGLNVLAIETASWSWTPVFNHATLMRLLAITRNLRSLQLCLPSAVRGGEALLLTLNDVLLSSCQLDDLQLHNLGRGCVASLQWADARRRGVNGPKSAQAKFALIEHHNAWDTGRQVPKPNTALSELLSRTRNSYLLSHCLTSLSLHNFCACSSVLDVGTLSSMLALRRLELSCLQVLKHMKDDLPHLQALSLSLAESWTCDADTNTRSLHFPACETHWSQMEVSNSVMSLPGLQELEVCGNPESVNEVALRHHGSTLRRLKLLHRKPFDRKAAYEQHAPISTRMHDLPSFIAELGRACPMLNELSLEAPNASTEFDGFLTAIKTNLNTRTLHIHRSHEPYADTVPPTKFSYARFTRASALSIWSLLRQDLPLVELKITIGNLSSWDDHAEPTIIAPDAKTRTMIVRQPLAGRLDNQATDIVHIEHKDACTAMATGRPGPLLDYWQHQADVVASHAEERNEPIYPQQHFVDGHETQHSALGVPPDARWDPDWNQRREETIQAFRSALQAQHEAEVSEARHPSREYY